MKKLWNLFVRIFWDKEMQELTAPSFIAICLVVIIVLMFGIANLASWGDTVSWYAKEGADKGLERQVQKVALEGCREKPLQGISD